ncbi:MAG: glycosyltransferase family 2 protein [Gaiellaceae bacterium]
MPDQIPVSVIVMTKNEERNLGACLSSVERFAEVFVVDSGSTDATRAIAQTHGAIVRDFEWNGRYPKKKQWALDQLPFAHDWVLYVDADERVTYELAKEITALFANGTPRAAGYFITLDYVFLGRVLRHGHQVKKLALFNRARGRFVDYPDLNATNMWEVEGHYQPAIEGPTVALRGRIRHEDHDSLYEWFARHNRYSDWEAVLRANGALTSEAETLPAGRQLLKRLFARLPFRGFLSFIYTYVFRLGLLDGRAGFQFAVAKAFYYWQVDLKLRELRAAEAAEPAATEREVTA